ncbi:hypothetical protein [Asaia bogorensis]|uniref:hypothetical protein n=1 Tax=Asaia bogorensis TaxID=91915 RepID=UPI00286CB9F5|nr:hypothetical protein [Asaia bogorensis]
MRLSSLLASTAIASLTLLGLASPPAQAAPGYLRDPALSGTTLVFDDEQSVWSAALQGGNATRLTAPIGSDPHPILSPDGKQVAFLANYDGPQEIYVMPVEGGTARRVTFENQNVMPIGWDRKGGYSLQLRSRDGPGTEPRGKRDPSCKRHEAHLPSSRCQ